MQEGKGRLQLLPDVYAVCRLDTNAPVPEWATRGPFFSITRTSDELSVVCPEVLVPSRAKSERGWKALAVEGPLDFSLTGVLSSLAALLAGNGISIFVLSTYDTDYVLVKGGQMANAVQVLCAAGYDVDEGCEDK